MGKTYNEAEVKKKLGITEWKNLSGEKLKKFFALAKDIDKETFIKILDNIPNLVNETNIIMTAFKECINNSTKMSSDTKAFYLQISNNIFKLLENENLSNELKLEFKDMLQIIIQKVEELDKEDKKFMKEQLNKFWGYAGFAILAIASILGVNKFGNKN